MWNAGLDETQTGIRIARRNINNLRYTDDTTLMVESEEDLKSFLMKVKEESEKAGLKLSIQKTKIMASYPIMSWQIDGEMMETVTDFIFLGSRITADDDYSHEIIDTCSLEGKLWQALDSVLKRRDIILLTKVHILKAMVFPVVMYRCKIWTKKKAKCQRMFLKTLESPLDCTIKPVHPKGDQPWIFIGRTDAEAPILWPPDAKSWLIGRDRDSGKDWGQQEKSVTEDEMVGWHHWLSGQEFEHSPGVDEGQGSLPYCSPWGHKESDLGTEQ